VTLGLLALTMLVPQRRAEHHMEAISTSFVDAALTLLKILLHGRVGMSLYTKRLERGRPNMLDGID